MAYQEEIDSMNEREQMFEMDAELDAQRHGDYLDDPLDDGTLPLAPGQFDPLCEVYGFPWPSSPIEAASFEYEIAHW